jgi:hypothetical protein
MARDGGVRPFGIGIGIGTDAPIGRMHGVDTGMVRKYAFSVLEVVAAWVDRKVKTPRTLHHRGFGSFMVAGKTIRLPSEMR